MSATDNAREEAEAECAPCIREHPRHGCADVGCRHNCQAHIEGLVARWAAGRAETTTATTEDALDAATEAVEAEFVSINAGSDHGARDVAEAAVYAFLGARGLLATARTRPTETEWGARRAGVTLRFGSERDAREHQAKHRDSILIRREIGPWTEADQ